ncbi:MAG: hypothetical protein ISR83_02970 [Candidatus Marinimicrobia bacterium]|nr:hypothetical protein [Candidatus Neomarinimicrobiota bacterium]
MKNIILIFVLFSSSILAESVDQLFEIANEAMSQEYYREAANQYESILHQGFESGPLYYNLGNAYFRQHLYGHAIWAYEKSLQFRPRNDDAIYNLDLANARIVDRIDAPDPGIILTFYRQLKNAFTLNELVFWGAGILLLSVLIYGLKRLFGFYGGLSAKMGGILTIMAILIHGIALDKYWTKSDHISGILIANGVDVFSGPFERDDSILFRVNEGTKADIVAWEDRWVEIILMDGKKGWIPAGTIRKL